MRKKKPHIATLDEAKIVRNDQYVEIEYCAPTISGVRLEIGPDIQK